MIDVHKLKKNITMAIKIELRVYKKTIVDMFYSDAECSVCRYNNFIFFEDFIMITRQNTLQGIIYVIHNIRLSM